MFEQFLIDHGIYQDYMTEFEKLRDITLGQFYNATPSDEYIISAFEWDKTEGGYDYWEKINDVWVR